MSVLDDYEPQSSMPRINSFLAGWRHENERIQRIADRYDPDTGQRLEGKSPRGGVSDHRQSQQPTDHIPPSVVSPKDLEGITVPERRWLVKDWLPAGYTTLLYSEGGLDKTLLGQMLMTSAAIGASWLGMPVEQCRCFGFFCEDGEEEVFARQASINDRMGVRFDDLGNARWCCPVGQDNTLIRFSRSGEAQLTSRFQWLRSEVLDFGARLVVVDTAGATFGGSEIDRAAVTAYVGQALTSLAQDMDGAVLLLAHPSRAGKATGSGDSGSTAWSASARSRWYLHRPEEGADPDARLLTRMKANAAATGDTISLRWRDWFLDRADARTDPLAGVNRLLAAEQTFLRLLDACDAAGMPVSLAKSSGSYAPKVFSRREDTDGVKLREFEQAMHNLISREVIWNVRYLGSNRHTRDRLARKPSAPGALGGL